VSGCYYLCSCMCSLVLFVSVCAILYVSEREREIESKSVCSSVCINVWV
jgi:hypothetical protein